MIKYANHVFHHRIIFLFYFSILLSSSPYPFLSCPLFCDLFMLFFIPSVVALYSQVCMYQNKFAHYSDICECCLYSSTSLYCERLTSYCTALKLLILQLPWIMKDNIILYREITSQRLIVNVYLITCCGTCRWLAGTPFQISILFTQGLFFNMQVTFHFL